MGRSIDEHREESVEQLLAGFKKEVRKYRKRERALVQHFKNEVKLYKKRHPNTINYNFERAMRRLQKEDAKKKRWSTSSVFNVFRKKSKENNTSKSDTEDEEDEEDDKDEEETNLENKNAAVKVRPKLTSSEAIYSRKGRTGCKGKSVINKRRSGTEKKNSMKICASCTSADELAYDNSDNSEESGVEFSDSNMDYGLVINIPSLHFYNNELNDQVSEEKVHKKNKKKKK